MTEYIFNWKSGGWNSVYANSREEALEKAKLISAKLEVDEKTLRIAGKRETERLAYLDR